MRITAPRRGVAEVLVDADGHVSTTEVWRRARSRGRAVDRSTVHRTLVDLAGAGVLTRLPSGGGPGHWTYGLSDPSQYLVFCTDCRQVSGVAAAVLDVLARTLEEEAGFRVSRGTVSFQGRCARCVAAAGSTPL